MPAVREANMMAVLATTIYAASLKASSVIKMLMVKPMPARIAAPASFFQLRSLGREQMPITTEIKENNKMPAGFPMTRPVNMPIPSFVKSPSTHPCSSMMVVLASAKMGKMI